MKKEIIGASILFIILFTILLITADKCNNELTKEVDKLESRVGTKIIINKDTLLIIDCSVWDNSYTLEDGREISYKLVEKLETKQ